MKTYKKIEYFDRVIKILTRANENSWLINKIYGESIELIFNAYEGPTEYIIIDLNGMISYTRNWIDLKSI